MLRRALTAVLVLTSVGLASAPTSAKPLDAGAWKRARRILPAYLWQKDEKARRRAKVDRVWTDLGLDDATLTRKQMDDLGRILRAGSPFTTEKKRSRTLRVATGKALAGGKKERMPVRVEITTKYKPGCGRSFPLVITTHGLSGLDRLLMGSTAEEVLSSASIPVLTISAFGKSLL